MATHSSILARKSHGQSLAGYSQWGHRELNTMEHVCTHSRNRSPLCLIGFFFEDFKAFKPWNLSFLSHPKKKEYTFYTHLHCIIFKFLPSCGLNVIPYIFYLLNFFV